MKKFILIVLIISLLLIPLASAENDTAIITPISIPDPIIPPIDIQPTIQTPEPTPIPTTIKSVVTTQKPTVKPTNITTQVTDDPLPKFVGVIFIAIAICVLGAVITYFILTRKMKREDEEEIIL
jgi:hypothetical protein